MSRVVSLLLAAAVTAGLLLLPAARGHALSPAEHALLAPLLLVDCALFTHAVGFVPRAAWLRRSVQPVAAWSALALLLAAWLR
jgi:predicted membrane protein